MKGIRRHLYWSATSTKAGFGALIVAKWSSFLRHVANIHNDHPNELYKKCNHEPLQERLWIKRGTAAHDKLKNLMLNKTLLNDVAKLSPDAQTSSLEGFHATLNHWHPKMIGFSFLGTCCRHILASLYFNENVKRTCRSTKDGKKYYRVTYPKFKLGEEAVKEVLVPPTYEYADGICKVLFTLPFEELKIVFQKYSANVPEPLNRQFPDRKCKEDAVKDYEARKKNSTPLFPSVSDQDTMLQKVSEVQTSTSRPASVRRCGNCKMPGHNRRSCNVTMSS